MINQFYNRFDEQYKGWVASLVMILGFSLWTGADIFAQQCAEDSTVISWDTVTWVDESTSNTYAWPLMPSAGINVDVEFEMEAGVGGDFESTYPILDLSSTPEIDIDIDIADGMGLAPSIIKIRFDPPVRCVSFIISDIDALPTSGSAQWIDSLYIFGNDTTLSPLLTPQSMTPTFTVNGGQIIGTENSLGDANGDVLVEFGGSLVDSVTIHYMDALGDQALANRSIGLFGNLSYSQESLLPVELLSFDLDKDENCHPMIKWETTHEYDLEYYAIEYSYDGVNFSNAAIVQPKNTYTGVNHYEQVINRKLNTDNYFRLVKKELDGSQSVLALDAIDGRGCFAFNSVNVYPNPAYKSHFYLEIESSDAKSSEIIIYDQTGRVMSRANYALNPGNNWFKVSSKSFAPGTYFVQFKSNEEVMTRKVHIIN